MSLDLSSTTPHPDYPFLLVTEEGNIYNRRVSRWQTPNPKHNNTMGYPRIRVTLEGRRKYLFVHRLVAETHLPNPQNYPHINHLNGDKGDFTLKNLEWATRSMNMRHALDVLGRKMGKSDEN